MRTAIIHDWLTGMRGGEKVLEVICGLMPDADLYTLVHVPGSVSPAIEKHTITTSFIQKLPMVAKRYRTYLPLFPAAIERFDLRGYDTVLSSSHCAAKGVVPPPDAFHLCYCHTPMRYVWDLYGNYFGPGKTGGLAKVLLPFFANYLRLWDAATCSRVDRFVANSAHVQKRILKYYGRRSDVVHPPVDTRHTRLSENDDGYFLAVSAFAPYKRLDLAIEAFKNLGEKLLIVGSGPEEKRLKSIAGPNIEFLGWAEPVQLRAYYANCRALIFPGEEDFGIVPVEVQCWGKPVIAYGRGGALESVKGHWVDGGRRPAKGCTGIFFRSQTVGAVEQAVRALSKVPFNPKAIRAHALTFDVSVFERKMKILFQNRERL